MAKKKVFDFRTAEYVEGGIRGFSFDVIVRLWKARFGDDFPAWEKAIWNDIPFMTGLKDFMEETWDKIEPMTVQEAFAVQNMEQRRIYFDCIGVKKIFTSLTPKLLDKQTVKKSHVRWDKNNKEYDHTYDDIYELYQIDGNKLFTEDTQSRNIDVYAVHCVCPSTDREYWIYVPEEAVYGENRRFGSDRPTGKPDAIRAIAWTIQLDITNPKRIIRQGDIIIAEEGPDSKSVNPYHITKEQYLSLMYSET